MVVGAEFLRSLPEAVYVDSDCEVAENSYNFQIRDRSRKRISL